MTRPNGAGVVFPKSVRVSWGKSVRRLRGNTSQAKFAAFLGIDQATLSKIEHGDLKITDSMKWLICGRVGRLVDDVFPMPPIVPPLTSNEEEQAA